MFFYIYQAWAYNYILHLAYECDCSLTYN